MLDLAAAEFHPAHLFAAFSVDIDSDRAQRIERV